MGPLQNLFLVADADNPHSAAFERTRALALAAGARVHVAAFAYTRIAAFIEADAVRKAREAQMETAMHSVEQQATCLRDIGVEASSRVTWAETPLPGILSEAYRREAQLLIKDVGQVSGLHRLLTTELDLELLRRGRLPLMLVAEGSPGTPRRVAVAVDVLKGSALLNHDLLDRGREIARLGEGELHLVHVGPSLSLPAGADAAGVAAGQALAGELRAQRLEAFQRLAEAAQLPKEHCHLLEGPVATTLRDFAVAHRIDLLVLATANKAQGDRQLMGRVAEDVVAQASCSLLCVPVEAARPD